MCSSCGVNPIWIKNASLCKRCYQKRDYLRHRRRRLEYSKEYQRGNPIHHEAVKRYTEKVRALKVTAPEADVEATRRETRRRRNERQREAAVGTIDRQAIYDRDNGICQLCSLPCEEVDFTVDHIIPLARGGEHSMDNLQTAHMLCNQRKGAHEAD